MIRSNEHNPLGRSATFGDCLSLVSELEPAREGVTGSYERRLGCAGSDRAEAEDDAQLGQGGDFGVEVGLAPMQLLGRRPVSRRGAMQRRTDQRVAQLHAVVAVALFGPVGKSGAVERSIEPDARRVAGERPARTVRTVCPGGESDQHESSVRIAERRDRTAPIRPLAVLALLDTRCPELRAY